MAATAATIAGSAFADGHSKDIVDTAVAAGSFETLVAAVTAAGLVDTLKGGVVGQSIQLVADNGATIRNSSTIRLQGGQNFQMRHGDTLQLTMFRDQVWQEIGRSINNA